MKSATTDLTKGSIIKALLLFTIPIMLGNILQQLYNVADTAIIGNVLGDIALAAVGAAAPIYEIVIGSSSGFSNGLGVIIARNFGAKQEEELKKSIAWTYILALGMAVSLTLVGVFGIRPLLSLLDTPDNLIDHTTAYMRIIFGFYIVTMLYNMFASMLRAIGNSKAPLYFLGISTVLNVGLDILFIKLMGIPGAAYATGIAQLISVICCVVYIKKKCPILSFDRNYLKKDWKLVKELLMMGLSMSLMFVVVSIGSVALQSAVNSFGDRVIAAHSSARRIDSVLMLPIGAFSASCATFTSQNYGAEKMDRVKKGVTSSIFLCFLWSAVATILAYLFGATWVRLLTGTKDMLVLETAVKYIRINIPFFGALSVLIVIRSSLQGLERKVFPLIASTVELLAKFIAVGFVTPVLGYFGVCILEPIIWILCAIVVLIDYVCFINNRKQYKNM